MDKEALTKARDDASARFNNLEKQRGNIVTELNRLQGEYRTYQQLIDQLYAEADKVPEAEVVPKEEVKDAKTASK